MHTRKKQFSYAAKSKNAVIIFSFEFNSNKHDSRNLLQIGMLNEIEDDSESSCDDYERDKDFVVNDNPTANVSDVSESDETNYMESVTALAMASTATNHMESVTTPAIASTTTENICCKYFDDI